MLQVAVVVLECVIPAGSNTWVRQTIAEWCKLTNFHCRDVELHLHDVWAAKRSRWWAVLSSQDIGPIPVWPFDRCDDIVRVNQIIPKVCHWDPRDEMALSLNLEEQHAFRVIGEEVSPFLLNMVGKCPTALHSWGSQLHPCPCECRSAPLSSQRISEKGLFGVITKSALAQDQSFHFRHLHPSECAALFGVDPTTDWGLDVKLALCALGQLASPIQSTWVFSHIGVVFDRLEFGTVKRTPPEQLLAYKAWLLSKCSMLWPDSSQMFGSKALCRAVHAFESLQLFSLQELLGHVALAKVITEHVSLGYVLDVALRGDLSLHGFFPDMQCDSPADTLVDESTSRGCVLVQIGDEPVLSECAFAAGTTVRDFMLAEAALQRWIPSSIQVLDTKDCVLPTHLSLHDGIAVRIDVSGVIQCPPLLAIEDGCVESLPCEAEVPCSAPDPVASIVPSLPMSDKPIVHADPGHAPCMPGPSLVWGGEESLTVPPMYDPVLFHADPAQDPNLTGPSRGVGCGTVALVPIADGPVRCNETRLPMTFETLVHAEPVLTPAQPGPSPSSCDAVQCLPDAGLKPSTRRKVDEVVLRPLPILPSPLIHLPAETLLTLQSPKPVCLDHLQALRMQQISASDRLQVLHSELMMKSCGI